VTCNGRIRNASKHIKIVNIFRTKRAKNSPKKEMTKIVFTLPETYGRFARWTKSLCTALYTLLLLLLLRYRRGASDRGHPAATENVAQRTRYGHVPGATTTTTPDNNFHYFRYYYDILTSRVCQCRWQTAVARHRSLFAADTRRVDSHTIYIRIKDVINLFLFFFFFCVHEEMYFFPKRLSA